MRFTFLFSPVGLVLGIIAIVKGIITAKAFVTIFDSNITTLIAAIFLFQFGTGPIKGFAVTLTIGLCISMFTAVVVTKLIYDFLFKENFINKIKL